MNIKSWQPIKHFINYVIFKNDNENYYLCVQLDIFTGRGKRIGKINRIPTSKEDYYCIDAINNLTQREKALLYKRTRKFILEN